MKKSVVFSVFLFLTALFLGTVWAVEDVDVNPNAASEFARLPAGVPFPEGIAVNPATGQVYVSTFIFGPDNMLIRFAADGSLEAQINFGGTPLLGLAFNSRDNNVYIANFGASQIQRVDAGFADMANVILVVEGVADIPLIGAPPPPPRIVENPDGTTDEITFGNAFPAPNALTFNSRGDLFVSDSFQGAVFQIQKADKCGEPGSLCSVNTVTHDPLLATAGFPPFGANGMALSGNQRTLFVANTGDDRILTVDISSGNVGVLIESINGADGIAFDAAGNLVVAANQADNVLILDGNTGRIKAKLGDFLGFNLDGTVNGLLFPASVAIVGNRILVTNAALPLTGTPDEPEGSSALTTYTISEIEIPPGL